ncbi:hypothetical protein QBC47DRAFT_407544 [Echria macrotheca]|uniref:Ubiquitin-like protease family profile domain-containing protein n=1 Tax=Echria macrotheca TaxID=438768 RepID=A0AAJ0F093_9PEZI|nr:hypothetical protein QBC47DRAFT_407544 [Echria macrotheca]
MAESSSLDHAAQRRSTRLSLARTTASNSHDDDDDDDDYDDVVDLNRAIQNLNRAVRAGTSATKIQWRAVIRAYIRNNENVTAFPAWAIEHIEHGILINALMAEFGDKVLNFLATSIAHRMRAIAKWASLPNNDPRFLCLYFGASTSRTFYENLASIATFAESTGLDIDHVYDQMMDAWRSRVGPSRTDPNPVFARAPLRDVPRPSFQPRDAIKVLQDLDGDRGQGDTPPSSIQSQSPRSEVRGDDVSDHEMMDAVSEDQYDEEKTRASESTVLGTEIGRRGSSWEASLPGTEDLSAGNREVDKADTGDIDMDHDQHAISNSPVLNSPFRQEAVHVAPELAASGDGFSVHREDTRPEDDNMDEWNYGSASVDSPQNDSLHICGEGNVLALPSETAGIQKDSKAKKAVRPLFGDNDLEMIRSRNSWLNDTIISTFMDLAVFCRLDAGTLDCTLLQDLEKSIRGTPAIRAGVNIDNLAEVILGFNIEQIHWVCVHLDLAQRCATLYDSRVSGLPTQSIGNMAQQFVEHAGPDRYRDWSAWTLVNGRCPQQANTSDCGVFTIVVALHLVLHQPVPEKLNGSVWRLVLASIADGIPLRDEFPRNLWVFTPISPASEESRNGDQDRDQYQPSTPRSRSSLLLRDASAEIKTARKEYIRLACESRELSHDLASILPLLEAWLTAGQLAAPLLQKTIDEIRMAENNLLEAVQEAAGVLYQKETREALSNAARSAVVELQAKRRHLKRRYEVLKSGMPNIESTAAMLKELVEDLQRAGGMYHEQAETLWEWFVKELDSIINDHE